MGKFNRSIVHKCQYCIGMFPKSQLENHERTCRRRNPPKPFIPVLRPESWRKRNAKKQRDRENTE